MGPTIYAIQNGVTRRVWHALAEGTYRVGPFGDLHLDPAECVGGLLCQPDVLADHGGRD